MHNGRTVQLTLAYGSRGLRIDVPDAHTTVVRPHHRLPVAHPLETIQDALRRPVVGPPLRDLAKPGYRVAISVCDITRPQPRPLMLEAILAELDGVVRPKDVTVIIATGTHRSNTQGELDDMLGPTVRDSCRVVNHDARDASTLVDLGMVDDVPVLLCREWVDADLRITTGFVEPHFFAGFSGGPKMVAPGLAGLDTTLQLHNARRIGDRRATWGVCEGNPVHDAIRAVAAVARPAFALDVLLNDEQRITAAFGGPLFEMHRLARERAKAEAMVPVDGPFDIVVTTNSGYPLDQNLYQAVKGISAAAEIVRDGGTIICAAECRDGLPEHGSYSALLASRDTPEELLRMIEAAPVTIPDQWQVQIQARVQCRARVFVHADGLTDREITAAHFEPVGDVSHALARLLRQDPHARICVIPEGPQTIAYIA
jgi:nickel-dependent lactate racemase